MRKEFKPGIQFENETEYYATEKVYHIYKEDACEVSDERYIPLRARTESRFDVFAFIKNKKNITLDFKGATLVMHGKIQPFLVDSSENIAIKNCNITYDRAPFTEAEIIEATSEYAKLRLNENCPCRVEDGKIIPYCETWENKRLNHDGMFYQVFDAKTRRGCGMHLGAVGTPFVEERKRPYKIDKYIAEYDGDDIIIKGEVPEFYRSGRKLIICHETRNLSNVFMIDSKDILIENYRILLGTGMGIFTYRTENITLDGFRLTYDEQSPCIVCNAADAVHSFGTSGKFEIKNSVFEGMIDDAINIHSNFRTVNRVCSNEIYSNLASCEIEAKILYKAGDVIAVYNGLTMEETAKYKVKEIVHISDELCKFVVDRPVLEHKDGDLIESLSCNCDVNITNCVFAKANSHLRFQSRGKFVMSDCECELEILLSGDASYWFESGPVTDLTVENCRFKTDKARIFIVSEIMPTEKEPYYHKNLRFINNEFDTQIPIHGGYADNIVFKGNSNPFGKKMKLVLTNCGQVDADNCVVERKTEKKTELKVN